MKKLSFKSFLRIGIFAIAFLAAPLTSLACTAIALILPSGVMLAVLDPSTIAFDGKQIMAMNEAVFTSTFVDPPIDEFHTIIPGIVAKQQIAFLGLLGLVGKAGSGCSPTADDASATISEKFWNPEAISMRLEECYKDYVASFFVWAQNKGIKRADLVGSDVFNFIEERATVGLNEAKLRHAWFGDTDAANYNSSPAGKIKNGVNLSYFNAIDGFWKQIYAIVAADSTKKAASITKNAGVSYVAQKFSAQDVTDKVVMGYFTSVINDADERLSDREDKILIVTKSVYDQYKKELGSYANIEASYQLNINGTKELMFDGIPVRKFSFMDRTIKAYLDNGTVTYQPHRIVLTTKSNLQIGVESEEALNSLDAFYDKKSKLNILDAEFLMDAKVVEDYMISVAY